MNGELPEGWTSAKLGTLFDFKYGKGLPQENRKGTGPVPVYGSNGAIGHHDRAITKGTTIIVGRKGSVGEVHLSPQSCWPIDTTYFIDEFPPAFPPGYWKFFLESLRLGQQEKSSAIPGISRSDVYEVEIAVPPVAEQGRIVAKLEKLLGQVDGCRKRLARVPALLKRFRQSVLDAACSGRLTEDWRGEHSEITSASDSLRAHAKRTAGRERNTRRMKPARGLTLLDYSDEFPGTWAWLKVRELVELGAILDVQDGNHGELYPRPEDFGDVGSPYISAEHVINDRVQLSSAPRLRAEKVKQLRIGFAKPNDVVLTHNATVGRVAILPLDSPDVILSTSTTYYRVDEAVLLAHYLASFLRSAYFQTQLETIMEQTTRNQVSVTKQVELGIALPPLSEQQEIVRRVEKLLALADQIEARFTAAKKRVDSITQSILAKAFSGELVPTEFELAKAEGRSFESAEEMLKRIRANGKPEQKTAKRKASA